MQISENIREDYRDLMQQIIANAHDIYNRLTKLMPDTNQAAVIRSKLFPVLTNRIDKQLVLSVDDLQSYSQNHQSVTLVTTSHRNELDTLPRLLYPHSAISLHEAEAIISTWSYDKKSKMLHSVLSKGISGLDAISYSWDILADYQTLQWLSAQCSGTQLQSLTVRYGYDIPEIIEKAELVEQYEKSFDMSFELYSLLQQWNDNHEAQYAVLNGHKNRGLFQATAANMQQLLSMKQLPDTAMKRIRQEMGEQLHRVHPLLAQIISKA